MPATGRAAINRAAAPIRKRLRRGHGPLLPSMIYPNGPWLGEGRPAVTHCFEAGHRSGPAAGHSGICAGVGFDGFRCAAPILHADSQDG